MKHCIQIFHLPTKVSEEPLNEIFIPMVLKDQHFMDGCAIYTFSKLNIWFNVLPLENTNICKNVCRICV